jgi:eukaryotic-like serine/threonine-protein kinase
MSKDQSTGKGVPGKSAKKPQAGKSPGITPAPKTKTVHQINSTTLETTFDGQEKVTRKNTPAPSAKAVLQHETQATANSSKDQTLLPSMASEQASSTGEAGSAHASSEKAASVLGDYKLLKKLGQGGMGTVYKAQQVSQEDRIVAVKVLAKELSSKEAFVQRFLREARIMSKLDHPNVLRYFEVGQVRHHHYLAMEYVEGGSIEGWLKKLGRFSIGDALHIILKTAAALQHAHEKSLIHRDIKPDNILLTKDGVVKLADLGLAKDTEEDLSLTKTGAGAGTPIYMAPEQARDVKNVDARVDIYALGIMLYVFLTGQPPFQGGSVVDVIIAKEKGLFDPIRKYNDQVPSKIDNIVDKMMARDPRHRFNSCSDLIDALSPLGIDNKNLSFLAPADETSPGQQHDSRPAPGKKPQQPTQIKVPTGATRGLGTVSAQTKIADEEHVEKDTWYWNFKSPQGRCVQKKLTIDEVRALIKAGAIDADTPLSKLPKTGFRTAASFSEFQPSFRATIAIATIPMTKDKKLLKKPEKDQEDRQQSRWLNRMATGTIVGLAWILFMLIGLVVVVGVIVWLTLLG